MNNIRWLAKTSLGNYFSGTLDDGTWRTLKTVLQNESSKIIHVELQSDENTKPFGTIEDNKDGYFLGNKVIANLQNGAQIDLVGLGYYSKGDDLARIKWYRKDTLELIDVEVREGERCGFCLIKN